MATREVPTVELKVFVDKEKSKVLFAECGKEFVDVLLSFLTLPLGTIVRLLGKDSQAGCLDELYKSVEGLSADFFRTEACKTMLLRPINAAARQCCQLKVRVDDTKHREVYVCGDASCCANADCAYCSVPGAVCKCGKVMTHLAGERPESDGGVVASGVGVFVKEDGKFIVTDDLQVAPASTSHMLSLLDKFEVQDPSCLEQRTLLLSSDKMINLLKRSLTSKNPLTGHYFDVAVTPEDSGIDMLPETLHPEQENDSEHTVNSMIKIKVLQTKNNSSVLYAEVGGDFVDLIFGLLCIPLGSIVKNYWKCASKGCVENLYSSIIGSAEGFLRSEVQNLLLSPNLAPFVGSGASTMIQVEEVTPYKQEINACFKCFKIGGFINLDRCHVTCHNGYNTFYNCSSQPKKASLTEWDPKSPKGEESENGESYVKQAAQKFIITDNLNVLPLSVASTFQIICDANIQRKELVEKELTLTKTQIMDLLRAALVTRKALSTVLLPPENVKELHHRSFGLY